MDHGWLNWGIHVRTGRRFAKAAALGLVGACPVRHRAQAGPLLVAGVEATTWQGPRARNKQQGRKGANRGRAQRHKGGGGGGPE